MIEGIKDKIKEHVSDVNIYLETIIKLFTILFFISIFLGGVILYSFLSDLGLEREIFNLISTYNYLIIISILSLSSCLIVAVSFIFSSLVMKANEKKVSFNTKKTRRNLYFFGIFELVFLMYETGNDMIDYSFLIAVFILSFVFQFKFCIKNESVERIKATSYVSFLIILMYCTIVNLFICLFFSKFASWIDIDLFNYTIFKFITVMFMYVVYVIFFIFPPTISDKDRKTTVILFLVIFGSLIIYLINEPKGLMDKIKLTGGYKTFIIKGDYGYLCQSFNCKNALNDAPIIINRSKNEKEYDNDLIKETDPDNAQYKLSKFIKVEFTVLLNLPNKIIIKNNSDGGVISLPNDAILSEYYYDY